MQTTRRRFSPEKTAMAAASALLFLGILSAGGCSAREQVDPQIFTWQGKLLSPGTVRVRNLNGPIEVLPATDSIVKVTASARWHTGDPKKDVNFQVASRGNEITICANWGTGYCLPDGKYTSSPSFFSKFFRRGTDASVTFTVYVPARIEVDAVTVNGSVTVTATAPVRAKTVNGSIKVATAVGPVDAETINGSVDARMTTLSGTGAVRAKTVNGSASAYVPESLDATYDIQVVNGRIGGDFGVVAAGNEQRGRHATGSLGAGGRRVEVHTINGRAELWALKADGTLLDAATPRPSR